MIISVLGSDAAIETADVVLMTDAPSKVAEAINIGRKTHSIVWQNIILAMAVKALFILLGAIGIATLWEAVFADVGVALLANSECHQSNDALAEEKIKYTLTEKINNEGFFVKG